MARLSPRIKSSAHGNRHLALPVDPKYPSTVAATTVVRAASRTSFARSPRASFISTSTTANVVSKMPDAISQDEYFRLLKKTDVLGHLLRVNDNLLEAEGLLEVAEVDNSKLDAMNKHILVELEMFKGKYYETQRLFKEHIEQLTWLCLREEALQKGHPDAAADQVADKLRDIRMMEDLHKACASSRLVSATDDTQSRALVVVAHQRVEELRGWCRLHRRDLLDAESVVAEEKAKETSIQVTEVQYAESVESALKHVQVEKDQLLERMQLTDKQNAALHDEIATLKLKLEAHKQQQRQDRAAMQAQQSSVASLLQNVKNDIKKRYGFVPPVLDAYALQSMPPPPPNVSMLTAHMT
ncbi:hypothetical protein H310_12186 [Aphanomyces invadans]|uniref:Uncharacterized protein n=1 Tax=Aphanomyces invadans TaxID=157072 RepID=A0A024TIF0_9STRA|nr:hypothetical protein H310_12186 [Aphanomyces invadans]ETV93833.1 hypothetical protein H310_12186 [Aphanomyces invadans]|eukprot:XP_008877393.1 hypothetical protein H310_12186 [Aphanomyces invadans]